MTRVTKIPGRIESAATGNVVTGANSIMDDVKGKKQNVINSEVDAELVRLDQNKQNNLTFDNAPKESSENPVKSGGVYAADKALSDAIEAILLLIPSAASALNQLADKNFVNSSISTATATPRGTYNLVSDLDLTTDATREAIAEKLGEVIDVADLNDYAFVQVPVSDDDPAEIERTERYKFNGDAWIYEYTLNTSGFTAAQWEAINSGITSALVAKLNGLPTAAALELALGTITQNIQNIGQLIPSEATVENQLADKAYVLAQILAATPSFKGQFTTLAQLQDVTGAKAGDLGIVRTKDSDGHDVFTFYQYLNNQWNEYYVISYHPQDKPATTGWLGDYPYNGMGRIELPMNMVDGWPDNTWIYLPKNDVVYLLYSWHLQLYAVYNTTTQEGLGLDDNLVVKPENYDIADLEEIVNGYYLPFTEDGGVWTITKPDGSTITSTELNNTNIYHFNDPNHHGINVLTQEMFNRTNTNYIIQYDFTLGDDITVPQNCVLEFDGGSLSNGSLVLQNTLFDGVVRLGADVEFSGTCANQTVYQSWFEDNDVDAFIKFINNVEPSGDAFIVNFESGTYYPTVRLAKETNKNYVIEGNFAKLVYSDSSIEEGVYQIEFKAHQHDNTRHIMQSVVEPGSEFIEFDSTEGINAGDFLTLMDLNTSSFSVVRNYQQGEIIRVAKVEGNKVYPDGGIFGIYKNLSNSMCYGIVTDFIKVTVKNLVIELDNDYPAEYDSRGINFRWCLLELDNIYSQRFRYNIELLNCLNSKISNCKVYSGINATGFDNYGITLSHCQNIEIDGGEYFGGSHGIAVGGGYGGEYNIVNRFINIHDAKAKSRKYKYGLDGHGNCEYFKVSRCNGDGVRVGGDYITINNNSVDTIELSGLIGANAEVVGNLINKEFYLTLSDLSIYENSYNYFTKHTINVLIGNNIFSKNATCAVLIRQHKSVNSNTINTGVIVVKGNLTVNTAFYAQTELYDANDIITDEFDSTICIQDNISTEYNDGSANLKGKKVYYRNNISNTRQNFLCEEAYIENNRILHAESSKYKFIFENTVYTLKYINIEKNIIESLFVTFSYVQSFDNDCITFIKENTVKTGTILQIASVYPEKLYFINNILLGDSTLTNSFSSIKNVVATCGRYNSRADYNIGNNPNSIVQAFTKLFDSNRNSYYKDAEDNYFYPMSNPSCSLLPTTGDTFDVKYSSGTGSYQTVMGLIFLRYVVGNDSTLGEPTSISTIAFRTEKGYKGDTKIKILGGNIEESLISIKIAKDGTNKDIYYNISITGYTLVNANMLVTNMYQGVSINPCFKTAVDTALNNPTWRDVTFIRNSGTFGQKPNAADICVGFKYFCTDKQTTEGTTDGIMIYYKGQDTTDPEHPVDVWVDALGRVVS